MKSSSLLKEELCNFKVVVRVRPPLPKEKENGKYVNTVKISHNNSQITLYEFYYFKEGVDPLSDPNLYTEHTFSFDRVYGPDSSQQEVYENTARGAVQSVLEGYNSTILAYGQTGTGKTYTMEGFKFQADDPYRGIVPRCMEEIFQHIESTDGENTRFMVRASYLQIYMETINDLLRPDRVNLNIREDKKKGFYVDGLSEWVVRTPKDIYTLIKRGTNSRATAYTKANDISSRSHAVFIIVVEQLKILEDGQTDEDGEAAKQMRFGKLNLVDLAGSERLKITGATGQRLEECKKINQSLSCLGNVISVLVENKPASHIPYRDSKLTRLLEDSLGGNCKTTMMGMISPAYESFNESLSTLKFANRAKKIKNRPKINQDIDSKAMLTRYEKEIQQLRNELEERNKHLVDASKLFQLEEEKKRLEEDRVAALEALEKQSKDFLQEREEKKRLEQMIKQLESSVVFGGKAAPSQKDNYDRRFHELERERQQLEEDRAQVDQYKQLLLKQRDIMIALTTRLNERDETIVQLQEELDAYDRIHYEAEEMLEIKKTHIDQLEDILRKNGISLPSLDYKGKPASGLQSRKAGFASTTETEDYKKIIEEQKETVLKLQRELKARDLREKDFDLAQLQSEYQEKINKINKKYQKENKELTDKLKVSEDNAKQLIELVQNVSRSEPGRAVDAQVISLIREKVDNVVNTLSQQNDPSKLHSVAHELLSLQKVVKELSAGSSLLAQSGLHSPSLASQKASVFEDRDAKEASKLSKESSFAATNGSSAAAKKNFSLSKYQRPHAAHHD